MTASNGVPELPQPEKHEPSHVVLNYGCSDWKGSSQRAAELYDSGMKLWVKTDLRDIERQLAQSATIKEFSNPNLGVENPIWRPYIEFREYWRLVKEQPKAAPETYHCSHLPTWKNHTLLKFRELTRRPDANLQKIKHFWNNSTSCESLRTYIRESLSARKVTKIVCFGIGDMCREPPEWMIRNATSKEQEPDETKMSQQDLSMVQHLIALTLVDVCRTRQRTAIRLLAQDPDYIVQTQTILEENGFEIVGRFGAGGFSEIDDESIVFSPFPSAPVKQILADIARPALVISDGFGAFNDHEKPWADADSPRTKQMWQEYQSSDFPVSPEDIELRGGNLSKLKLYLRTAIETVSDQ